MNRDHIAVTQVARRVETCARPGWCAGRDNVTRIERHEARQVADQIVEREDQVGRGVVLAELAVDARRQMQAGLGRDLLARLVEARYDRNDYDLRRGTFRVRGDVVEIVPAYEESGIRIELFGDEVERISAFDPLTGRTRGSLAQVAIYPSSHYVTPQPRLADAIKTIEAELLEEKPRLEEQGKLLEAQRLYQRTPTGTRAGRSIPVASKLRSSTCWPLCTESTAPPCGPDTSKADPSGSST